ncbi:UNVERIFIED_CONTAM: hypothetical protein Slati_3906100 [Sesamum latifolium]|uniref:Uncharacterized protein n=1 Tax=Sesamum latifolium TaxID=2727402 RepID=A0AAW2TNM0_9LAMI
MGQAHGLGGLIPSWALLQDRLCQIHTQRGASRPWWIGLLVPLCGASFVLSGPESVGLCTSFSPPHSKEGDPRLLP